jgi:hypothetical protein
VDLSRIEWRKASYSANGGGACVEVGAIGRTVAVRDSKDPDGAKLVLTLPEWEAFIRGAVAGDFDLA